MARIRPGGTRGIRNPSLPDTGEVTVNLGSFDPAAASDKPAVTVYGSSTPQAQAFHAAEAAKNGVVPPLQRQPSLTAGSGDPPPEERSPHIPYVDDFENGDGSEALRRTEDRAKKRLEERLQRSEKAVADALRWGQQQAATAAAATHAVTESQLDTVASALAGAEREADAAEAEMISAKQRGDVAAEVKAQRALMQAEQRIATLRAGKDELEVVAKQRPTPAAPPVVLNSNVEAILAQLPNLIDAEREWIRRNPESITDPNNQQAMQVAFRDAQKRGLQRGTPEYFAFFEDRLGIEPDDGGDGGDYEEEPPVRQTRQPRASAPAQRRVSAPVSPSGGARGPALRPGQIRLTEQQREAARISGVDEETYARGVARLAYEKSQGMYGSQPTK